MASIFGTLNPAVSSALNKGAAAKSTQSKTTTQPKSSTGGKSIFGKINPQTQIALSRAAAGAPKAQPDVTRGWLDKNAASIYKKSGGTGIGAKLAAIAELGKEKKKGAFTSEEELKARGKTLGLNVKQKSGFWAGAQSVAGAISGGVTSMAGAGRAAQQFQAATVTAVEASKSPEVSADPNVGSQTVNPDGTVSSQAGEQTMGGDPFAELASSDVGQWAQTESPIGGLPWYVVLIGAGVAIYLLTKGEL